MSRYNFDYEVLTPEYVKQMLEETTLEEFILHFCAAGMYDVYVVMQGRSASIARIEMHKLLDERFKIEKDRSAGIRS